MKLRLFLIHFLVTVLLIGSCQAATYTLPEKMNNQLAIGSGLKGTFRITAEGELFSSPLLKELSDADFSLRGISSGKDLHYYVFQQDDQEQQSAVTELYRKDNVFYLRSDMVQGKVLSFPSLGEILESRFTSRGETVSPIDFLIQMLTVPEKDRSEKWEPVLLKYQNELEMWLADFTVNAESVRLDTGTSALDFSYDIPMDRVFEEILRLYGEYATDQNLLALLDNVMTPEEKQTYVNSNLLYYYQEALQSLALTTPVRITKRVSAMGELLHFRIELPLDQRTTGYQSLSIEMMEQRTIYAIRNSSRLIQLAFQDPSAFGQPSFDQSIWFASVQYEPEEADRNPNLSVRIDIHKTNETYDDDSEKSHQIDHYKATVEKDIGFIPDGVDGSLIPDMSPLDLSVDLHYSSKYAQNSATTLEIGANIHQASSELAFSGKFRTAAPWLFMPFEIIDPVAVGTDPSQVLEPYFTDWISNAASIIRHQEPVFSDAETAE